MLRELDPRTASLPPTPPAWSPASPTPPVPFLPLACTLNASRVLDAAGADARRGPRRPQRARAVRAGRGRRPGPGAVPGGRADPRTSRTRPAPCTGCAWGNTYAGAPGAGRGRGHAVRARGRARRPARAGRAGPDRSSLIGGGAQSEAVRRIAPSGASACDVACPRRRGEYVADGAARQAAWALAGTDTRGTGVGRRPRAPRSTARRTAPAVREQYAAVRDLTATRRA